VRRRDDYFSTGEAGDGGGALTRAGDLLTELTGNQQRCASGGVLRWPTAASGVTQMAPRVARLLRMIHSSRTALAVGIQRREGLHNVVRHDREHSRQ